MARLHTLARRGDFDEAVVCISAGTDVNARSIRSFTPLMLAAQNQHLPIVRLLLASGAQVNLAHPTGRTALHFAAAKGALDTVQALIQHGADVNATSNTGCTAMIEAAQFNHPDVVDFLKECGADATLQCRDGLTADAWLAEGGVFGRAEKLLAPEVAAWCNPNERPLASESDEQHIRKLMAEGLTPEQYAAKHGRRILVYSYGYCRFRDIAVETWAHRLAEVLFTPGLMDQAEEQFLQGEELEDARQCRARRARRNARINKRKTL